MGSKGGLKTSSRAAGGVDCGLFELLLFLDDSVLLLSWIVPTRISATLLFAGLTSIFL